MNYDYRYDWRKNVFLKYVEYFKYSIQNNLETLL